MNLELLLGIGGGGSQGPKALPPLSLTALQEATVARKLEEKKDEKRKIPFGSLPEQRDIGPDRVQGMLAVAAPPQPLTVHIGGTIQSMNLMNPGCRPGNTTTTTIDSGTLTIPSPFLEEAISRDPHVITMVPPATILQTGRNYTHHEPANYFSNLPYTQVMLGNSAEGLSLAHICSGGGATIDDAFDIATGFRLMPLFAFAGAVAHCGFGNAAGASEPTLLEVGECDPCVFSQYKKATNLTRSLRIDNVALEPCPSLLELLASDIVAVGVCSKNCCACVTGGETFAIPLLMACSIKKMPSFQQSSATSGAQPFRAMCKRITISLLGGLAVTVGVVLFTDVDPANPFVADIQLFGSFKKGQWLMPKWAAGIVSGL